MLLQPFDRRQVEMVGRLVEQQDVGRADQRPGEADAASFAAGEVGQLPRRLHADGVERRLDEMAGLAPGRR